MGATIETAETYYGQRLIRAAAERPDILGLLSEHGMAAACATMHWPHPVAKWAPSQQHPTATLDAFVSDSRWVVCCPCGGAQIASKEDRRLFCVDCLNMWAQGMWVTVNWPHDADAIEAVLGKRVFPNARNWRPGSTVADLVAENAAHPDEVAA